MCLVGQAVSSVYHLLEPLDILQRLVTEVGVVQQRQQEQRLQDLLRLAGQKINDLSKMSCVPAAANLRMAGLAAPACP